MTLVPVGAVTVTSTIPDPDGLVAVIWVALLTTKLAATAEPNLTAVAPVKLVPVIVTDVPPAIGPLFGASETTVGGGGGGGAKVNDLITVWEGTITCPPASEGVTKRLIPKPAL